MLQGSRVLPPFREGSEPGGSAPTHCYTVISMLKFLRSLGLTPDMFYVASIASIVLSLLLWFIPRGGNSEDKSRPERLAIFVGLWPPTLFLMGHALREEQVTPTETGVGESGSGALA
jgi:hypothetical protein